ncbi:MAG: single-stranded DNA-binding protein [Ruminococcaceae bacterium]|nr:single-stranded DNA-binding protein [Oscillospiraceae bacterium]
MITNRFFMMGRLCADPEQKLTPGGKKVCTVSVAVPRNYDSKKSDFFTVEAWDRQCDTLCRYFRKGSPVAIVSELRNEQYTDKNGQKRTFTKSVAMEVSFCFGVKKDDAEGGSVPAPNAYAGEAATLEEMQDDDDLPF